ncbi:MAG: transporter substrate-binding domain-containing protein [Kiritimatiellae bacterium]|nr:transporter substrate-binding domain-containing protein [Kiritimatiellia bacterium]
MKKFLLLVIAAIAIFAIVKYVKAPKGKESATVRMITEATFPPYEFRQGTEVVGIDVEICKAVAKELGKELAVEDVEFDSVIPSLIAGKAELAAAGITVTEDRKMKVDFSVPYVRTGIVYVYAKANPFEDPDSGKGHRVGVQNGTTSADFVREQLGQEPEMFDSPASAFAALKQGKVEVVIADVDPAKNLIKGEPDYAISDFLTVEEYAVAVQKGNADLLAVVNRVIEGLQDSGRLDQIIDEWTAVADALQSAEEAAGAASEAVEDAKDAVAEAVESAKDAVAGAVEDAKESVESAKDSAAEAVEGAKEKAAEAVEAAKDAVSEAVESSKEAAADAVEAAKETASDAAEAISDAVESATEKAADFAEAAKEKTADAVEAVQDAVSGAVDSAKDALSGVFAPPTPGADAADAADVE